MKEYIKNILEMAIPIYLMFSLLYKIYRGKRKLALSDYIFEFIFVTYIVFVLVILEVIPINISDFKSINITPNIIPCIKWLEFSLENFQRILMFIPFGILYPLIINKKSKVIRNTLILSSIFSFSIEIMEYYTGRYFNIDEIIFSIIGTGIGIIIYLIYNKRLR